MRRPVAENVTPLPVIKKSKQAGYQDAGYIRQVLEARQPRDKTGPLLIEAACDGLDEYVVLLIEMDASPTFNAQAGTPLEKCDARR